MYCRIEFPKVAHEERGLLFRKEIGIGFLQREAEKATFSRFWS